jgi:hypothetical protein
MGALSLALSVQQADEASPTKTAKFGFLFFPIPDHLKFEFQFVCIWTHAAAGDFGTTTS